MSEPFIGEIEIFGFGFAPKGWVACAGQLMPINQNQALFSILGTTYGGNGTTNFALPDLRSRLPLGQGNGPGLTPRVLGEQGGEENHTLILNEMPTHNHPLNAQTTTTTGNVDTATTATLLSSTSGVLANNTPFTVNLYTADANPSQALAAASVGNQGGGLGHPNVMPYLTLNVCIALVGIFPSRN